MRYGLPVTCPHDGAAVEHVAAGTTNGWETRSVIRCTECDVSFIVIVRLASTIEARLGGDGGPKPIEHGTERGYQQHRAVDGTARLACAPCREAHNAFTRGKRKKAHRRELVPT